MAMIKSHRPLLIGLSLLAVIVVALFVHPHGRDACKAFDRAKFTGIATQYVKYSRDHSAKGKFLGRFGQANIDTRSVRRSSPDDSAQDIIGVVPIDVGNAMVMLQISSDCNFYPIIPDATK